MEVVDLHFGACPVNIVEEECVQFQGWRTPLTGASEGSYLEVSSIKIDDFRGLVLEAVLFYPTHPFSSWKCNVSVSRL